MTTGETQLHEIIQARKTGGWLILEPHTYAAIEQIEQQPRTWYSSSGRLFFDQPHLVLHEYFWHEEASAAILRNKVIDAASGDVVRYAQSLPAYRKNEYRGLRHRGGVAQGAFYPALTGSVDPEQEALLAITAQKSNSLE